MRVCHSSSCPFYEKRCHVSFVHRDGFASLSLPQLLGPEAGLPSPCVYFTALGDATSLTACDFLEGLIHVCVHWT